MNAVVQRAEPTTEATALIQLIERAAVNPNVDIDKMERLLQMQERILERNAKAAYTSDLAVMLPKLPIITERGAIKNREGGIQSKYALWEDINEAIGPILAAHGFSLTFRTGSDGGIKITAVLSHREGHVEETTLTLPADTSGSKNAVQAVASSVSYGKRYTAGALLNITSRGEDDDGRKAAGPPTLSDEQVANLEALLTEVGASKPQFLKFAKVETLDQILAKNYTACVKAIEAKRK